MLNFIIYLIDIIDFMFGYCKFVYCDALKEYHNYEYII